MPAKSAPEATRDVRFYCGAGGAGKTHQICQAIRKQQPPRLIVFDPDDEYASALSLERCADAADLARRVPSVAPRQSSRFHLSVAADSAAQFELVCRIVWALADARFPMTFAVDELAGVTGTAKAANTWHTIVTRARKYRLSVFAGAQAPAEVDKTIMRQRSYLWCGYLERPADHYYVHAEAGVPRDVLAGLKPRQGIQKLTGANWRHAPYPAKNRTTGKKRRT